MALPVWALQFKQPRTEIKCIKGKYYQYEVRSVYCPQKKRSIKKTIRLLGKITEKEGFVPSSKNQLREAVKNPRVDLKFFGVYAIFSTLLKNEIASFTQIFGPELAEKLLSFAMMRWAHQSPIKRAERYHSQDFCSETWSREKAITDKVLTSVLRQFGEKRELILQWMSSLLPSVHAENFVLMDSTHVMSELENLGVNVPGYNPNFDFGKQIRLMYLFSADIKQPVYYRLVNGNIPDVSSLSLCVKEMGGKNVIFIADKGFYSNDNVKLLKNQNFQFLIPLRRNNSLIDYTPLLNGNLKRNCDYFSYQKRMIWYYQYEKDVMNVVTFLDDRLRVEEEQDYLQRIETHPEEYSREGYLEKLHTFGTLTVVYKTEKDFSAQKLYEIYKQRNEIEVMFDSYKNFLNADKVYMQNRYVLEGWLFANFIAMIAYYKLFDRLRSADLLKKYSPKDIIEIGKAVYQISIQGNWHRTEMTKKTCALFKCLGIDSLT